MFARTSVAIVLLFLLQTDCNAQVFSRRASRATEPGAPTLDAFVADGLGLLSKKESDALTKQAKSGISSAVKLQPF